MNLVTIDTRTPIYVTHIFNYHLVAVSCIEMLYKSIECLSLITLNICVQGVEKTTSSKIFATICIS